MKIITKTVEERVEEEVIEDGMVIGVRPVVKMVEKRYFSIPQPDILIEEQEYLATLQKEKEDSERIITEAQEKISKATVELEKAELLTVTPIQDEESVVKS